MYCTKCGAEVLPGQKFCNRCGAPVDPGLINVAPKEMNAGAAPAGEAATGAQNGSAGAKSYAPSGYAAGRYRDSKTVPGYVPPKQKKIWPIVTVIVIALLLMSIGMVFTVKKAYDYFSARAARTDKPVDFVYPDEDDGIDYDFGSGEHSDPSSGSFGYQYGDTYPSDDFNFSFSFGDDIDDFDDFFDDDFGSTFDDFGYKYETYDFATAIYFDNYVYLENKGTVDDFTVLWNGKTAGEFCDYVDRKVLDKGYKLDRDLLYDLLALHLVDSSLVGDNKGYFEPTLVYCLTFVHEFGDQGDPEVESCMYETDAPTVYYYNIEQYDKKDTWVVDYTNKYLYFNNGDTEYNSVGEYSMFSDNQINLWYAAIDEFFGF